MGFGSITDKVASVGASWIEIFDRHAGKSCADGDGERVWLAAVIDNGKKLEPPGAKVIPLPGSDLPAIGKWFHDNGPTRPQIPIRTTDTSYFDAPGKILALRDLDFVARTSAAMTWTKGFAVSIACVCTNDHTRLIRKPGVIESVMYTVVWRLSAPRSMTVSIMASSPALLPTFWASIPANFGKNPLSIVDTCC